jgi:thiol-disulfide isomerase/thioredoxin
MRGQRLLAGATVLALGAAACGQAREPAGPQPQGSPALNATIAPLLPTDALALPSFDFEQYQVLLRQLHGTPVVVNIWASWCGPCRAEAPHLTEAADRFGDRVQFLGVDILDDRTSARDFIREFHWPYPHLFDPDGEIRDKLGYFGQPITIFYNADGEAASDWVGAIGRDELMKRVRDLLR